MEVEIGDLTDESSSILSDVYSEMSSFELLMSPSNDGEYNEDLHGCGEISSPCSWSCESQVLQSDDALVLETDVTDENSTDSELRFISSEYHEKASFE